VALFKKRGKWYIDYYYEGRRIRECIGTRKRQAKDALNARKGEIVQGRFNLAAVGPSPRFEEFVEEYKEWAKVNLRSYAILIVPRVRCLLRYFAGLRLREITPWVIEKYKAQRRAELAAPGPPPKNGRRRQEHEPPRYIMPSTINRDLGVLSAILTKAVEWGRLREHPIKGGKVKRLHEGTTRERELTDEEEERLIKLSPGWLQDVIVVAVDTGLRRAELVGLSWDRVDLVRAEVRLDETKSGRARRVPLTSRAHAILSRLRRTGAGSTGPLAVRPGKWPWRVVSAFRRARSRAGLKDFRFHDLRHTYATRLVRAGADLLTVARLLGHRDLRMVQRYAHPGAADARRAVLALERRARTSPQMDTSSKKGLRRVTVTP